MSEQIDNPPAFPTGAARQFKNIEGRRELAPAIGSEGMTLRDYFAANAPITLADVYHTFFENKPDIGNPNKELLIKCFAEIRYQYADAMLKARQL